LGSLGERVVRMKRLGWRGLALILTGALLTIIPAAVFSHELRTSTYTEGGVKLRIDGVEMQFDPAPYIAPPGRTMVPMRAIFETLGAAVIWDEATKTVHAERGGRQVTLQIGSTEAVVDGSIRSMDVAPAIRQGRTYVPLRFVAEALNSSVNWDSQERKVSLTSSTTSASTLPLQPGTKLTYRLLMVQLFLHRQVTVEIEQRSGFPGTARIKLFDPTNPDLFLRLERRQLASSAKLLPTNLALDGTETAPWLSKWLYSELKLRGEAQAVTLGGLGKDAQAPARLAREGYTTYVLNRQGQRIEVPAMLAVTPKGDRIWLLDDPNNPLILKVEAVGEPLQGAPATYGVQLEMVEPA
jgi:hypothetical protein